MAKAFDISDQEERKRAVRALLQRPLVTTRDEHFVRIRKHAAWLQDWFQRNTGWHFHLAPTHARLFKLPGDLADATRPARGTMDRPFTRRTYAWFCLSLAVLESCDRQTTLGKLADGLVAETAESLPLAAAGMALDLEKRPHRQDLVQVVRLLLSLHILEKVDGNEEEFLAGKGDALYRIEHAYLSMLLQLRRAPSSIKAAGFDERLATAMAEVYETTESGENRRMRHALTRRLLEDPVVYWDSLSENEKEYLSGQWPHITRQIAEATGLTPEVRAEGLAMADERGDLTDRSLPEEGTEGHLTLLLAESLASSHRRTAQTPVALATLESKVKAWISEYGRYWRKDAREPGAERHLTKTAIERLAALRLIRLNGESVFPLAAICRYRLGEVSANATSPNAASPAHQEAQQEAHQKGLFPA